MRYVNTYRNVFDAAGLRKQIWCHKCGKETIRTTTHIGYNTDTGKNTNLYTFKCPKKKWWNNHTILYFDGDGWEIVK